MMQEKVELIAETPSLAGAIQELLEADGIEVKVALDFSQAARDVGATGSHPPPLLLVACNAHHCDSARRWRRSPLGRRPLLVVGARDPELHDGGQLHLVSLPLQPRQLLRQVHELLEGAGRVGIPSVPVPVG